MPRKSASKSPASIDILTRLDGPLSLLMARDLVPCSDTASPPVKKSFGGGEKPGDYPFQVTRAYDLSVTAALDANIPVVGSGSIGALRRVIVLERVGYDERALPDGGTEHVGFAIRLCVTVNKLDANVKLSLPFITASAQLGTTEAVWTLQIVGLSGPKIAAVEIIPTELNVETFVLAKQSLQKLVEALSDAQTRVVPKVIARLGAPGTVEAKYLPIVAQAAAVASIARRWSVQEAANRYSWDLTSIPSSFAATYQDLARISSISERPGNEAVAAAARVLGNISVQPR